MSDERTDLLVSLIAGSEETEQQWNSFEASAEADPGLWRELALAQRDQSTMSRALSELVSVADRVEVPEATARPEAGDEPAPRAGRLRVLSWSGWAVAALLGVAAGVWFAVAGQPRPGPPSGTRMVGESIPATADEALQAYLDLGRASGRVLGEVPTKVLLETRRAQQGEGYELLYLRQVLESMQVPDLYQFEGRNEQGQPVLSRWEQPPGGEL